MHFVVLFKIKNNKYFVSDPAFGLLEYDESQFRNRWIGNNANENSEEGIALLLEPTPKFYQNEFEKTFTLSIWFFLPSYFCFVVKQLWN
ncbi:Peptidase C39 family protein [compost metagenome]